MLAIIHFNLIDSFLRINQQPNTITVPYTHLLTKSKIISEVSHIENVIIPVINARQVDELYKKDETGRRTDVCYQSPNYLSSQ